MRSSGTTFYTKMKSKFNIFVVLASLVQSSYVLSSTTTCGLSEDKLPALSNLTINQNAALLGKFDAFNPLFDALGKLAAQSIFNLTAETEDDLSAIIAKALTRAKDAIDYSLDSIPIAVGHACSDLETTRATLYDLVDHVYVLIPNALVLAQSANYSEDKAGIEVLQAAAHEDCANLVETLSDLVRICLNTTDAATLAVIKSAQEGSGNALVHVINAVFNTIKTYAAALSAEHQYINLLLDIEHFRGKTLAALTDDIENKFSALKALYIDSQLNRTGIVFGLTVDQYTRTVIARKIQEGVGIIYDTIIDYWTAVTIGLSDDGDDVFSQIDAARVEVAARFNYMNRDVLMSFRSVQPVACSAITDAEGKLSSMMNVLVTAYFDAIDLTVAHGKNHSETLGGIDVHLQNVISHAGDYVITIFNVTANNRSWDADTAAEIASLQMKATVAVEIFMNSILDAIKILANASRNIGASDENDLSAIWTYKSKATSAISTFAGSISCAHVIMMLAGNEYEATMDLQSCF